MKRALIGAAIGAVAGALLGNAFMSLIHTCPLCDANSVDYLVELQRHAREPAARPIEWMPWSLSRDAGAACSMMNPPGRKGSLAAMLAPSLRKPTESTRC